MSFAQTTESTLSGNHAELFGYEDYDDLAYVPQTVVALGSPEAFRAAYQNPHEWKIVDEVNGDRMQSYIDLETKDLFVQLKANGEFVNMTQSSSPEKAAVLAQQVQELIQNGGRDFSNDKIDKSLVKPDKDYNADQKVFGGFHIITKIENGKAYIEPEAYEKITTEKNSGLFNSNELFDLDDDDDSVFRPATKASPEAPGLDQLLVTQKQADEALMQVSAWENFWQGLFNPQKTDTQPEQAGLLEIFNLPPSKNTLHSEPVKEAPKILELFTPTSTAEDSVQEPQEPAYLAPLPQTSQESAISLLAQPAPPAELVSNLKPEDSQISAEPQEPLEPTFLGLDLLEDAITIKVAEPQALGLIIDQGTSLISEQIVETTIQPKDQNNNLDNPNKNGQDTIKEVLQGKLNKAELDANQYGEEIYNSSDHENDGDHEGHIEQPKTLEYAKPLPAIAETQNSPAQEPITLAEPTKAGSTKETVSAVLNNQDIEISPMVLTLIKPQSREEETPEVAIFTLFQEKPAASGNNGDNGSHHKLENNASQTQELNKHVWSEKQMDASELTITAVRQEIPTRPQNTQAPKQEKITVAPKKIQAQPNQKPERLNFSHIREQVPALTQPAQEVLEYKEKEDVGIPTTLPTEKIHSETESLKVTTGISKQQERTAIKPISSKPEVKALKSNPIKQQQAEKRAPSEEKVSQPEREQPITVFKQQTREVKPAANKEIPRNIIKTPRKPLSKNLIQKEKTEPREFVNEKPAELPAKKTTISKEIETIHNVLNALTGLKNSEPAPKTGTVVYAENTRLNSELFNNFVKSEKPAAATGQRSRKKA